MRAEVRQQAACGSRGRQYASGEGAPLVDFDWQRLQTQPEVRLPVHRVLSDDAPLRGGWQQLLLHQQGRAA